MPGDEVQFNHVIFFENLSNFIFNATIEFKALQVRKIKFSEDLHANYFLNPMSGYSLYLFRFPFQFICIKYYIFRVHLNFPYLLNMV